ncbi:1,6-anhydro-N-acetylmuramyl-L-alanine amidase AmpD [Psychromonas sp. RZ22]|uniref:1,6-anhydro-N-acetylmuramyl-L-alanine amidase AmpD n=1 Tax=Psychromonas algarum TaxID=2555643 RepID=UPI0010685BD1|nr:1,6-anhydro-N-acetylmuramyl-L-alanine amidase AmpD [Psychromonas sp. RZ22]TEW56671.1 1,6-anhydro-N-acetylmuramyl-L-alanine amidase AmpD [Psychromonas sp. RZ22]
MINHLGVLDNAVLIKSPFFNQRPPHTEISLLVIHCISLPEGQFATEHIKNLFTGCLDCKADPSFADLEGLEVSAHCVIRRDGLIEQYVSFQQRAWHAGVSSFQGVDSCNDFSIGIELEGTDCTAYTDAQYKALADVTKQVQLQYPAITNQRIVGHSDIAPGRKTDPGSEFDWEHYFQLVANTNHSK